MRPFHIPITSSSKDEAHAKFTNHYSHQTSPKFLVKVILCTRPPDSITSFQRKQYLNAVIGTRHLKVMMSLVRHNTLMRWCDQCEIQTLMWQSNCCELRTLRQCDWVATNITLYTQTQLSLFMKKKIIFSDAGAKQI